ncbi:RNA polymerase sigma-70 factor (ECF subfamily) [Filimonas zeae]|uniref:DNA-directed RNA polymerase sigma-70 factor n=1 Tax=Filimonas zeae TaxID=1737353 RepID=A0A917J1K5_9BACT|nr:RNA polymerase sigma-70 factor [Filimonas zeae]MDR6339772.1 RNA polymerase sigma-70 factor (ECF subfamily) [Filimonas zeae]GGH69568.1 DNA-directed RNA polymerase sigma-70 factor [Filimonas zeae]
MAQLLQEYTDQELLHACCQNNIQAYNILFDRYFKRLYGFLLSLLKDRETAQELAMDVMLRIWQKRDTIVAQTELTPYLFRSAKNALYNHLRRNQLLTLSLENLSEAEEPGFTDADNNVLRKELYTQYEHKLQGLSQQRRQVFHLSRVENLTYDEIADRMSLSVHTVRNHMNASLRYFRENMVDMNGALLLLFLLQ